MTRPAKKSSDPVEVAGVEISKPDKDLLDGVTKLDLARYYKRVASTMLPHLRGRPVNMQRLPDGLDGPAFYEKKRPSHFPDWVESVRVHTDAQTDAHPHGGEQDQVVVDDVRSLVYLAQQACVTPHTWLCTDRDLEAPDQLVFDLDPSTDADHLDRTTLTKVRRATRLVGELLDDLGLTTYLKTTGSRGYHVLVPLRPTAGFDDVRAFARRCAEVLVDRESDLLTLAARKADRGDRVYVDVLRNGYGQTAVPAYAVRARPGGPVSTPLEWGELSRVAPDQHTVTSVPRRLARRDDPWADVRRHAQTLTKATRALDRLG